MTRYYHNHKINSIFLAVSSKLQKTFLILSLVALPAFISSCEEDPTKIGEDLFPGSDFVSIKSIDTLSVFGYTDYTSPVRTNSRYYSYLGKLSDPYFGETTADFVSQLQLYAEWPGGGAFTVDSVKFFMAIVASEGFLTSAHSISLVESTDFMNADSAYYSNKVIHRGLDFGTYPIPTSKIKVDTATTILIPLQNFVGEYLLRDTSMLFRSSTEPDFKSFFKGLYVSMTDSPDPLFLTTVLSAANPGAGIIVYYHNSSDSLLTFPFWINRNAVTVNRYTHSSRNGIPGKDIVNKRVKDTVAYLQNYDGVYAQIEIPGLKQLKSLMPLSVNKARLKVPVFFDSVIYKPNTLPSQILVRYRTAAGVLDTVPDYKLGISGTSYLGGTYSRTTNEYTFNLAVFTQLYLEGTIPEPVFELFLPAGTSKNVIIKMNENISAAKLEFTYTKF